MLPPGDEPQFEPECNDYTMLRSRRARLVEAALSARAREKAVGVVLSPPLRRLCPAHCHRCTVTYLIEGVKQDQMSRRTVGVVLRSSLSLVLK